jgi:hypothetical protein
MTKGERMFDFVCLSSLSAGFAQGGSDVDPTLMQFLARNPYIVVIGLGTLIPIVAIVFGCITEYLRKTRQAEIDASLKREMLERGMSADDIRKVLEARSQGKK